MKQGIINELVKVESGKCSARELVKALEFKTTKSFEAIFEKYVKEENKFRFKKNKDFAIIPVRIVVNNGGYKEVNDYQITIDMAKHICMVTGTDKAFEIREYFIQCEKFIQESQLTEEFLHYRKTGKVIRRDMTYAIQTCVKPSNKFAYSNFTNIVYKVVFGMNTKQLKESRGLNKKDNVRDHLTSEEVKAVLKMEDIVRSMLVTFEAMGIEEKEMYHKVKELIENKYK
ncbi:MAG: antA/AntB antirepressor family protein [Clostridium sp.]|uniref:antA/AntB antirepressor family protein n=1 Tax=Clostridium sp. TaxID=1506 RepID=UPI003F32CB16